MTDVARNTPAKVPVLAGGNVQALIPQSLEEAFRVSQAIAVSGLAPRGLDKPEQIMVAIMAGAELGLAPFQALQSIAVVNGRPTLWGDGLMAVARRQGIEAQEWTEGADDARVAHCKVTRPDNGEVIERTFSVADAKKAGLWGKQGPWQQYPQRMLQMRARAWALRDGCADMLRGFQVREEVEDFQQVRDVTPQATGMRARLEARANSGGFDPDHIDAALGGAEHASFTTAPEIDAVLEGDNIPTFDDEEASAGEVVSTNSTSQEVEKIDTADDEVFPGDRDQPISSPAFDPVAWAADSHAYALTFDREPALKKWWNAEPTQIGFGKLKAAKPALADTLLQQVIEHGKTL